MTSTYRIISIETGLSFGDYDGETAAEARDAYARDAGYTSFADLLERVPGATPDDLEVVDHARARCNAAYCETLATHGGRLNYCAEHWHRLMQSGHAPAVDGRCRDCGEAVA